MRWWDRHAVEMRERTRYAETYGPEWNEDDELEPRDPPQYEDDEVRRAVVHTREDLVLLVSYLSSLNKQLWALGVLLFLALLVLVYIAYRVS